MPDRLTLSGMTEEVLSDDYEEGEILDDDSLYDDVSSLEEFSPLDLETTTYRTTELKKRKEHLCKDWSLCRTERTGKHCYTRIRKMSHDSVEKAKVLEPSSKKPVRVKNLISKVYPGRKLDRKDSFHNVHFHRQKNHNETKHSRQLRNNHSQQPQWSGYRPRNNTANTKFYSDPNNSVKPVKTSLLKRLAGSSSMGGKIAENCANIEAKDSEIISDYVESLKLADVKTDRECGRSETTNIVEITGVMNKTEYEKLGKPKSDELNEWDLRIAALRTALLKKFSERKKNGNCFKRKSSNPADDSMMEYALKDFVAGETEVLKDMDYRQFSEQQPSDMDICDTQSVVIEQGFHNLSDKNQISFSEADFDCRAYSCYPFSNGKTSNPKISPKQEEAAAVVPSSSLPQEISQPPCLKEINSINNRIMLTNNTRKKRRKMIQPSFKTKKSPNGVNNKIELIHDGENEKDTAEENELRELALMSVKARSAMSEGMLVKVNSENKLVNALHVDTTNFPIVKDQGSGKLISNNSSSDPWDDVDEDILRAQLLNSMSNKIPTDRVNAPSLASLASKPTSNLKKINKENMKKFVKNEVRKDKNYYKRFIKKNNRNQVAAPVVQKLVINIESDSSEEDNSQPRMATPDIAASIDLLLQEVRSKTEREQGNSMISVKDHCLQLTNLPKACSGKQISPKPEAEIKRTKIEAETKRKKSEAETKPKKTESGTNVRTTIAPIQSQDPSTLQTSNKNANPPATPQGIKHLPAWQQEEYRRLKEKLYEKELLWKSVKPKIAKVVNKQSKSPIEKMVAKKTTTSLKRALNPRSDHINNAGKVENVEILETPLKKPCPNIQTVKESWEYSKDFSDMSTIVDRLEKDLEEFQALKGNTARLKKELALAQNKMLKKRRLLALTKDSLENKEKLITNKLMTEFPSTRKSEAEDQEKLQRREFELVSLKFKEISLRAKLACFNLAKEMTPMEKGQKLDKNESSSALKTKLKSATVEESKPSENAEKADNHQFEVPQAGNNPKRVFSVSESGSLDPFTPLCPFDMAGVCKDEECKYQHIRPT